MRVWMSLLAVALSAAQSSSALQPLPTVTFSPSAIADGGCGSGLQTTAIDVSLDPNGFVLAGLLLKFTVVPSEINLVGVVGTAEITVSPAAANQPGAPAFSFGAAFATNRTTPFVVGTITVQGCVGGGKMELVSQTYTDDNFNDYPVNTPVDAAIVVGATPPTAPPTPTSTPPPTPTPPASVCVGDCDGSGSVTVDELITMTNIALGNAPLSECPIDNADASRDITVNAIIQAVGFALTTCPGSGG